MMYDFPSLDGDLQQPRKGTLPVLPVRQHRKVRVPLRGFFVFNTMKKTTNRKPFRVDRISQKASRFEATKMLSDNDLASLISRKKDGFLHSAEWRALRQSVISHYGGACMCCKRVPDRGVNVDHIKPRKTHPHLSLSFENLQILCGRCNKQKGNKHSTDYRGTGHPA
jgi:5-methylcytosine-specific restriction endonuclease McrA